MKKRTYRSYSEKDLIKAVENSLSIRQVIEKLGLIPAGGNYETVKRYIRNLELDISHFRGQGWAKGISNPGNLEKIPLNNILVNSSVYKSSRLRERLINEGYKEEKCEKCGIDSWNGLKPPLELEHKNGNREDNRIENLEILCANCHSQTPFFRRRKSSLIGRVQEQVD